MGIIGNLILGGVQGLGEGGAAAAKQYGAQEHENALEAARTLAAQNLARLQADLSQKTYAANQQTDIGNIPARGAAENTVRVAGETALTPVMVDREKQTGAVRSNQRIDEETKLTPVLAQRQIDTLKAAYSPEVLAGKKALDLQTATTAAETLVKNMSDPNYVKALTAQARAQHVESAATIAQANLAKFQLGQAQKLAGLQQGIADATAAGPAGAEALKKYQDQVSALGYTGKWTNMAPLLTAGTTLMKAAESELDPASKSAMQAQAGVFFKMAGINDGGGDQGKPTFNTETGEVRIGDKLIGKAKSEAEARQMIASGVAPATAAPATGIVGTRVPTTGAPLTFPKAEAQKELAALTKRWQTGSDPDKVIIGRRITELKQQLAQ